MKTTYNSTDTLKGLAVISVLINHYLNMNMQGDCKGFANLIIAIFFIVSGYGIYCSLEHLVRNDKLTFKLVTTFYCTRIIRIFPLYWVAYITESVLFGQDISISSFFAIHPTLSNS
jgi:peptidoglycan/LPS O-acetylase OafA/YrhL